jgi:putative ABC transport system substrate-binding protein
MNNRRKLLLALGAAALASPLTPRAQPQSKIWRVGYLGPSTRPGNLESDFQIGALLRGMRELGYVEGKNLIMEWRYADNNAERLQAAANELAQLKVDIIVAANTTATHAARKATATIPIVMASSGDPVRAGFVTSLSRPGGNITGLTSMSGDLGPKHLEMLRSMVPKLSRVAVLFNPANPGNLAILKNVQAAARNTKAKILPLEARTAPDIEKAFSAMARENAGGVIVAPDALFIREARQIAARAAKQRLPSIAGPREFTEAGGLMSYGRNQADSYRRTAAFVDKILKGAKPGNLPVEQPTTFELFINGKTAKALGLKIPQSLLISAEKVIE